MLNRDVQRLKAAQVGMLMRAYRESSPAGDGRRGLTQDELLRRMASVDDRYGERYSHTTVSRWESGATRPNRQRLEVFGKALALTDTEIEGLISLAGINSTAPDRDVEPDDGTDNSDTPAETEPEIITPADPSLPADGNLLSRMLPTIKQALFTVVVPGSVIVAGAYLMAWMGWTDAWMSVVYIALVLAVRLSAGYFTLRSPNDLCELIAGSVFVLLTTPLLQGALIRVDHYGFYALLDPPRAPLHFMLALLVNLSVSTLAACACYALWKWQYSGWGAGSPARRAVAVILPPLALVYATMALITNIGVLIQLGLVLSVLAAVCIILLVLRDRTVAIMGKDRQFVLWATLTVSLVTTTFAAGVVVIMYSSDGALIALPDHNLLFSWDIDFETLGFTRQKAVDMFNLGYLWQGVFVFIYLVFFLLGHLIAAIYRVDSSGPDYPATGFTRSGRGGSGPRVSDPARGNFLATIASLTGRRRASSLNNSS